MPSANADSEDYRVNIIQFPTRDPVKIDYSCPKFLTWLSAMRKKLLDDGWRPVDLTESEHMNHVLAREYFDNRRH